MAGAGKPLTILHVMRSPVGGLFRHVVDLARGQAARGHQVGIVADASTGGARADVELASLEPHLSLGLTRCPMSRHAGPGDVSARREVARQVRKHAVDVIHGHGAKGGAYARMTGRPGAIRAYTPHGGSLHFSWASIAGMAYLTLERMLMRRTDLLLLESEFARNMFRAKIGEADFVRVVHNGVAEAEFVPVAPDLGATDIVFVGELRHLKGVDVLIDAIAHLRDAGRSLAATVVGAGPDAAAFAARAGSLGLTTVRFVGAMPARQAFALGKALVVPSRHESLPYIVLEAAAAGLPVLTTSVGGIPEIFGPLSDRLVPPGDSRKLAQAITAVLDNPDAARTSAQALQARIRQHFSVDAMTEKVLAAYREALDRRTAASRSLGDGSDLPPH